jgi:hypothetical protein
MGVEASKSEQPSIRKFKINPRRRKSGEFSQRQFSEMRDGALFNARTASASKPIIKKIDLSTLPAFALNN